MPVLVQAKRQVRCLPIKLSGPAPVVGLRWATRHRLTSSDSCKSFWMYASVQLALLNENGSVSPTSS